MPFNLPNVLTLSRIAAIPVIIACFWLDGWMGHDGARWVAASLFALASITDYFDGWLARRWQQISKLGRFLDPIADKLLVAAVLMMLCGVGTLRGVHILAALIILCREVLVSGLREFLAELRVGMPVSKLAKWKTAIQMVALTVLLVGDSGPPWTMTAGLALLWAAAGLTLITGYDYLRSALAHMTETEPPPPREAKPKAAGKPADAGGVRSI
jgi:cardiolipin synthase